MGAVVPHQAAEVRGVTEREGALLRALVRLGSIDQAAKAVRMHEKKANDILARLSSQLYLRNLIVTEFSTVLLPAAVARLKEMTQKDAKVSRGQLEACKTILDRVGLIPPKASDPERSKDNLEEMNVAELQDYLKTIDAEIARRDAPKVIDITPNDADFLE